MVFTEVWGILSALLLAWEEGWKKVIVESDSNVTVSLVREGVPPAHHCWALVRDAREMMQRQWDVQLVHTFREGNTVADCLANLAHSFPLGCHRLASPLWNVTTCCSRI